MSASVCGSATVDRVMAAIECEADMDGVATPTARRIAELVGISQGAASWAIHHLADTGRLSITGRVAGRGEVLILTLPDSEASA